MMRGIQDPTRLVPLAFLAVVLVGTLLLMLPVARAGPGSAPLLTALFTATSAACVTGLVLRTNAVSSTRSPVRKKSGAASSSSSGLVIARLVDAWPKRAGPLAAQASVCRSAGSSGSCNVIESTPVGPVRNAVLQ